MAELFNYRFRIPTTRAFWWDYGKNGAYFITICTSNREHYFGEIQNKKMILWETGKHAWKCWLKIPEHFPFVKLDAFVVMPNHIHGIIIINKPKNPDATGWDTTGPVTNVETQNFASLQPPDKQPITGSKNKFGPQSNNLASIIRGFKIGVTLFCKQNQILFGWQSRYYDHIIRDKDELNRIRGYIINNPANWADDVHYFL